MMQEIIPSAIADNKEQFVHSLAEQIALRMAISNKNYVVDSTEERNLKVRFLISNDIIQNIENIFECIFTKHGRVTLSSIEDFNKIKAAFSEIPEIITKKQASEILLSFEAKLKELSNSGVIDFDKHDCVYTATESFVYALPMVAVLKDKKGIIQDYICWGDDTNLTETISRLLHETLHNLREPYTINEVLGLSRLLCCGAYSNKVSSMSLLIQGVIEFLGPFKKDKKKYNTYLASDSSGLIKIGKSSDVYKREKSLRIGNATLEIIAYFASDIENELHRQYESKNVNGEWFSLSETDVIDIIKGNNAVWVAPSLRKALKRHNILPLIEQQEQ